jgi:hypothetical protein
VSFAAITLCVASERGIPKASVYLFIDSVWRLLDTPSYSYNSERDRGEWSASRPGRFTPGERASITHLIGGWADTRAGLNADPKIKIPTLIVAQAGLYSYEHPSCTNVDKFLAWPAE